MALISGLENYVEHHFLFVILESDSLSLKNILDGNWEFPWCIDMEVKRIRMLTPEKEVVVEHTLREGNKLANVFTNQIFYFTGTNRLTYSTLQDQLTLEASYI